MDIKLANMILRMMEERRDYWEKRGNWDIKITYETCADFVRYAIMGDIEILTQYDYYGNEGQK